MTTTKEEEEEKVATEKNIEGVVERKATIEKVATKDA
jgi:hypothetical protein